MISENTIILSSLLSNIKGQYNTAEALRKIREIYMIAFSLDAHVYRIRYVNSMGYTLLSC